MKIILGANISANGKVLLGENPDHHAPDQATNSLMQMALQAGNLVIGRKTYDFIAQFPGGIKQMLPGAEVVIISSQPDYPADVPVIGSAKKAISYLAEKGFQDVAVGGGTEIYNLFLDQELVTDIYFNLIPVITGDGGVLGTASQVATRFHLAGSRVLDEGIVQLHLTRNPPDGGSL
ncbi:dihydrofolate reductase family protein [Pedobacter yulinensis]|nr:dihydrofolate reductase [Pedobacter yulinensis]